MSARLSTFLPRACSGAIYAAVPRMTPTPVIAGVVIVGDIDCACQSRRLGAVTSFHGFREAEVQDLHAIVWRHLDVGGLQIKRATTPLE